MITQHFAVGDIQGCLVEFNALLKAIQFDPHQHQLWLCGDLINRGPNSLGVIRMIRDLPISPVIVLGNHDLHFLAVWSGEKPLKEGRDTFHDILDSPECNEICEWYLRWPLVHHDASLGFTLAHAGIAPMWGIDEAVAYSKEVERVLRSPTERHELFANMYGNKPKLWQDNLAGVERLRVITNYCTRMRFCKEDGGLELKCKVPPGHQPNDLMPWFKVPGRKAHADKIIFGHWASLWGRANTTNIYALDTGCVWGGELTAMRLEDEMLFSVPGSPV